MRRDKKKYTFKLMLLISFIAGLSALSIPAFAQKQTIKSQRFNDWHYRCVEKVISKKKKDKRCEVMQVAQTKQGGKVINLLTISFSKLKGKKNRKKTIITILAPLNVFLPTGMTLGSDKGKASSLKYRNCNQAGCWVQHLANRKILKQLKGGKKGIAKMRLINGQNLNISFSLKGLGPAIKAMESGKPPKGA
ncbi:MAG: invasion associated locus B family protein [Methyloligellaceae bacterium]